LPQFWWSLQAVEQFYIELVAGRATLADIGLAPAGAAPAATHESAAICQLEQQHQQQEQQRQEGLPAIATAQPAQEEPPAGNVQQAQQLQRRTFKVAASCTLLC
jgi:hemolysin activation/secretion protein